MKWLFDRHWGFLTQTQQVAPAVDLSLNHIYLSLHQAHRKRHFIEVTFDGDDVTYQSMILAIDPHNKTLLIDELFPIGFEGLAGQKLAITVRQAHGHVLRFQTRIIQTQKDQEGGLSYTLSMPDYVEGDQRRGAFRLGLPEKMAVESVFTTRDKQEHHAMVRDISITGLGLTLKDSCENDSAEGGIENLAIGDQLQKARFSLDGLTLQCDIKVCTVINNDDQQKTTFVGAEFIDLPSREQSLLGRCIAKLQRERLKQYDQINYS